MRNLIIFIHQTYLIYMFELKGIIFTQEYCKYTNQYFGSILNLNNGVRVDINSNIKTMFLFRRILIIEMNKMLRSSIG